jgi:hypothetical protein
VQRTTFVVLLSIVGHGKYGVGVAYAAKFIPIFVKSGYLVQIMNGNPIYTRTLSHKGLFFLQGRKIVLKLELCYKQCCLGWELDPCRDLSIRPSRNIISAIQYVKQKDVKSLLYRLLRSCSTKRRWQVRTHFLELLLFLAYILVLGIYVTDFAILWDIQTTYSVSLSPQANYTDWVTATCRRNLVPTFVDSGVSRGQRGGSLTVVNLSFLDQSRYFSFK